EGSADSSTAAAPAGPAAPGTGALPTNLLEREETVVRWLTSLLDRMKTDQFDPHTLLQESQEIQRSLFEERERRRQLEEELEQVKRGSIAVIKYIRTREGKAREELLEEKNTEITELRGRLDLLFARVRAAQGGAPDAAVVSEPAGVDPVHHRELEVAEREAAFAEREGALRRRIIELEAETREARADLGPTERSAAAASPPDRERDLANREGELRRRFEEIQIRSEEIERRREAMNFKDREIGERENEAEVRRKALEVEARRLEEIKKGIPADLLAANPTARTEASRLEAMEAAFDRREKELEAKEAFLTRRLAEAEELQKKVASEEADRLHSAAIEDTKANKVRTGVRRLDDLLFGGVPIGSQILVGGPAHTGKDVLARLFIADGLKSGQGALWVVTDRTYSTVREEMTAILPSYLDYEKKGMVRYVDLYSRSLGVTEADKGVRLLANNDKALLDQLTAATNTFATELKEVANSYRLVFESVSTVTAYLDTTATFRFLQPFIGRRKLDRAAAYYILESGMHSESDLQSLEHMMDGSVTLKVDQLKTFLSVRGITDVQSRAWVGFTFSKKVFTLGSFSLDHIR
ncbi:MAG: RAD55 family ATPase, partial [Thermoplasmata archaeon]